MSWLSCLKLELFAGKMCIFFQVMVVMFHLKLSYCHSIIFHVLRKHWSDEDTALKTITKQFPIIVSKTTFTTTTITFWAEYQAYYLSLFLLFFFHLFKKHSTHGWLWNAMALFKMPHLSNLWPIIQVISQNKIKVRCVNAIFIQQVRCKCQTIVFFLQHKPGQLSC